MSIEINGQIFESKEDYEKNYVVSSMNVEGLGDKPGSGIFRNQEREGSKPQGEMINKQQMGYAVSGAIKAVVLVIGIFGFTIIGFILLLTWLW
jgi:hypothetical protein